MLVPDGNVEARVLWNSRADLGPRFEPGLSLEIQAIDVEEGATSRFGPFILDNTIASTPISSTVILASCRSRGKLRRPKHLT